MPAWASWISPRGWPRTTDPRHPVLPAPPPPALQHPAAAAAARDRLQQGLPWGPRFSAAAPAGSTGASAAGPLPGAEAAAQRNLVSGGPQLGQQLEGQGQGQGRVELVEALLNAQVQRYLAQNPTSSRCLELVQSWQQGQPLCFDHVAFRSFGVGTPSPPPQPLLSRFLRWASKQAGWIGLLGALLGFTHS